ncbi:hypothetical protein Poly59_30330 [Rubripirellula reticaptiva]|uniref:Uncharacterized protein n=1 Tax=Rubripirellula reticaptiva TaxID=2528013 RepID=A0A5C6EW39_9BACT|nr:hypothetical protein Poly59_30330 [Rubripirellula reticaptiva]
MALRLFNHTSRNIFEASVAESDERVGKFFTDSNSRRIGRTSFELVATLDARFLGNPSLGLPAQVPFVYRVRSPDFHPFAYSVRPNGRIKILSKFLTVSLPKIELKSEQLIFGTRRKYDPTDAQDALDWAGVFGLDQLDSSQRQRAISLVTESWGDDWSSHCICPIKYYDSPWSILRGEWIRPFSQSASFFCPVRNSNCNELAGPRSTVPIATLKTDDAFDLFGGYHATLILTFCKVCKTFCVENEAN